MRWLLVLSIALLLASAPAAAQAPSRWTLSAGPSWPNGMRSLWGLRFRANYDLTNPNRPLRLHLEAGGLWGPTHSYFRSYEVIGGGAYGQDQTFDVAFGLSASLSPVPRARLSPYLTAGVLARQVWRHGWTVFSDASGFSSGSTTPKTLTYGQFVVPLGVGVRARLGGRPFQIEYRLLDMNHSLMFGTRLPF